MDTFEQMRQKFLADPERRAEYERLNREEFALLDTMLAARKKAGLTQTEVNSDRMTSSPHHRY